jgi:hypothetical protein
MGGDWAPVIPQNFNNVISALVLLFECSTTEGWVTFLHTSIDAVGVGMQPIENHNPVWFLYYFIFLIFGSFFMLDLFVGVMIDNFNSLKRENDGDSILLTEEQKQWIKLQQMMVRIKPKSTSSRPRWSPIRALCYDIAYNEKYSYRRWFEAAVLGVILLNTFALAVRRLGMSEIEIRFVDVTNTLCGGIFAVEAAVKLLAVGPRSYFGDSWNVFDFTVVATSIVGAIIEVSVWVYGVESSRVELK